MSSRLLLGLVLVPLIACQVVDDRDYEVTSLALPHGDPVAGREAFVSHGCTTCHGVTWDAELPEPVLPPQAPELSADLARQSPGGVVTSIILPSHRVRQEMRKSPTEAKSRMTDFTRAMTVRELIDVVGYLRSHGVEDVAQFRTRPAGVRESPL